MNDFEKYCKNRIKYAFFRFIFFLLFAILVFFLSSKLHLFSDKVYALETTTVYTAPNKNVSGSIIWLDLTTPKTQSLGVVQSTASYGFRFFIDKATQIGKIYKIRMNFNDYDYLHSNTSNYWRIVGYSGTSLNGDCTLIGYELKNQGSNTQNKTVDVMYQCPTVNTGVMFYNEDSSGDNLTRISTINWRLNSIQWETVDNNQDIINNQTQNTQNIINNNNTNTQNIIDNQTQNTQDIIDSNKVCTKYDKANIKTSNSYLNSSGGIYSSDIWGITDYISIDSNSEINITQTISNSSVYYCFYNVNKTVISCNTLTNFNNITIPNNSSFIRVSIHQNYDAPQFEVCRNGNQAITDSIGDITDALTDDSPVNMDSLGNTAGWLPPGPIDSIINLPLSFFNSLLTALNGSCTPLTLPIPFLTDNIQIPCISTLYSKINGFSTFWTWVGSITSVVILYQYLLALYKYYDDLTTLKANFIDDFGGAP